MILHFALLLFAAAITTKGNAAPPCEPPAFERRSHMIYTPIHYENLTKPVVVWYLNSRTIYHSEHSPYPSYRDFTVDWKNPSSWIRINKVHQYHAGTFDLFISMKLAWSCQLEVLSVPTFHYIRWLESEVRRPSGSKGGLVDGKDMYAIEFSVTRHPTEALWYPDNGIYLRKQVNDNGVLYRGPYSSTCVFDVSLCPEVPGTKYCYCKSVTGNTYTLIYNVTASFVDSQTSLDFVWDNLQSMRPHGVGTDLITLPVICRQAEVTRTAHGETRPAQFLEMVDSHPGNTSLTFNVTNLEFPYVIKISVNKIVRAKTGRATGVTTLVTDSDDGKMFDLSYKESHTLGCGREGSFHVIYKKRRG